MSAPVPQAPFRFLQLDHVVLRARDIRSLLVFYRDLLGCPLERTLEESGLYQLRAGASLIDLVDATGPLGAAGGPPPAREGGNVDHVCLRIAPFDAAAIGAWLDAAGVDHEPVARRYGADGFGPSIYLRDPEGNRIELKGPPEQQAPDAKNGDGSA